MPSKPWRSLALAAALACGLGCGESHEVAKPEPADVAHTTLAEAPKVIREEVLRTCDKWKPRKGGECDPKAVERDQLACWLEVGLPHLKSAIQRGQRQRSRDHRVLMQQNWCVEKRGWDYLVPGSRSLKDVS